MREASAEAENLQLTSPFPERLRYEIVLAFLHIQSDNHDRDLVASCPAILMTIAAACMRSDSHVLEDFYWTDVQQARPSSTQ
jgi:hypothetical protein